MSDWEHYEEGGLNDLTFCWVLQKS